MVMFFWLKIPWMITTVRMIVKEKASSGKALCTSPALFRSRMLKRITPRKTVRCPEISGTAIAATR